MFTYKYRYILKAWIFFLRNVDPTFPTTPPGPQFLWKFGPDFRDTGPEIEPRFPAKPLSAGNRCPIWAARGGNRACDLSVAKLVCLQLGKVRVGTAIHLHLLHGHHPWPRPDQSQNPKPKLQTGRLDFGFWILDFGFWILDFGLWILDFGFWISDFGFWILDFGFWILDFGFWILDFGFWILDLGFWILVFGSV